MSNRTTSLGTASPGAALHLMSPAEAEAVATTVLSTTRARQASVKVEYELESVAEFARNEVRDLHGDVSSRVTLNVFMDGCIAEASTQDTSPRGLAALVGEAESIAKQYGKISPSGLWQGEPVSFQDSPGMYADATIAATAPETQAALVQSAIALAKDAGTVAVGALRCEAKATLMLTSRGFKGYSRSTYGEFSLTARTDSGSGSGWMRGGAENLDRLDVLDVGRRAIDIATRSQNPVAVEPGRYTVILEPEAVAELMLQTMLDPTDFMAAGAADFGNSVFSKSGGGSKLGEQMADARVQWLYDPLDPLLPFSHMFDDRIVRRTHWIENGVLKNLAYSPAYAHVNKRDTVMNPRVSRLEVSMPVQSLEQMIASTERGIWVRRLDGLVPVNLRTLLLSGVTRDGAFLIESGKITRPIRNMRFAESPFFVLNKIDAAGAPQRSHQTMVCPRLKVHDFEFTSLSDAI